MLAKRTEPRAARRPAITSLAARTLSAACLLLGCVKTPSRAAHSTLDANANANAAASFELDGEPFCFAGANNYYLASKPAPMVDDVLGAAKELGFPVLRIWGFVDIGSLDGSVPHVDPWGDKVSGKKDGVYFQYFDPATRTVRYNQGPDGLPKLDYVLAKAGELGIKIILVLTNNWYDFGGMDQYLRWFGRVKHHEFYTAPEVKRTFRNWIEQLALRTNTINGRVYRDDPTIFSWELANEPRCKGTGPAASGWDNSTIVTWADEMSRHIKSLAPHHLVSVGDEGFLDRGGEHWAYRANDGVDHEALTALPAVDFGTYHSYPAEWGATLEWGERWIVDHQRVARRLGKPTVLEEYGVKVTRDADQNIVKHLSARLHAYERWNERALKTGTSATMVWMLGGIDTLYPAAHGLYRDHDGFTIFRGDQTARLLSEVARRFRHEAPACRAAGSAVDAPSRFVRVRRPVPPTTSASGWMGWGSSSG